MDERANDLTGSQDRGATGSDSARKDWVRPSLVYFEASYASLDPQPNHDGQEGFAYLS